MRPRLLLALLLVSPAPLVAQAGAPAELPNAAVLEFEKYADIYGGRLVAAFDSIPADKYGYRPTPVEFTVGFIAQHLEHANYALCGTFGHLKHATTPKDALPDSVKAQWPKDTLVARLRASVQFCDSALDRVGDPGNPDATGTLLGFETDLAEHYAQLSVYMRLLGLVPPSALARVFPPVVALPPSALAPYVGTYELTHGLDFVVTQRDGGLWIRSTNVATSVRLWPESPSEFFAKDVDADVTFVRGADGHVTGLKFRQYGRSRPARSIH